MDPYELDVTTIQGHRAAWVFISGEADISNQKDLDAKLHDINLGAVRVLDIDLSQLNFCDVSAYRRLVRFTSELRRSGREPVIRNSNSTFRRIAQILGTTDLAD